MLGFLAALVSPIFLSRRYLGHSGTTDHAILGIIAVVIVLVHLTQRRRTVRRLVTQLVGRSAAAGRQTRRALSDTILWILVVNAVLSGVVDFVAGHLVELPVPGPYILHKWHAMAALVLVVYVIVHVTRRRRQLRSSHIS